MNHTADAIEELVVEFAALGGRRALEVEFLRGPLTGGRCGVDVASRYPGASVMKILVAIGVHQLHAEGVLDLDEEVTVADVWWPHPEDGSVLATLRPDHRFTLREFAGVMLVASDNRAGSYLIDRATTPALERIAKSLGCRETTFDHPLDPRNMGVLHTSNLTSARDLTVLLGHLYRNAVPGADQIKLAMRNTVLNNRLTARFEPFQMHKTGTLAGVACDAAILIGAAHDLSFVLLSSDQPDNMATGMESADLAAAIWGLLGEQLD